MFLLHIACVDESLYTGINAVVPQHIRAQQKVEDVCFVNLAKRRLDGVANQFPYEKGFRVERLAPPYHQPDLVIFHEVYRPAYLCISRELRRRGIPYIIIPHGSLTRTAQNKKWLKKKLANLLLFDRFINGAAAIQCLSEGELAHTRHGQVKFVGTNGFDGAHVKRSFSDAGLELVYIGRLEVHIKGLDLLVTAVEQERSLFETHRCKLRIYGPDGAGERARLEQLIQRKGLSELICVHREVWGEEKRAALLSADGFVQTSRSEGMSMGLLEALGDGLPCVVTEGTGVAELVRTYDAGWACETTVAGIAAALREAILDRERFPEKSAGAEALIRGEFLWERIIPETLGQYRRIAEQKINV